MLLLLLLRLRLRLLPRLLLWLQPRLLPTRTLMCFEAGQRERYVTKLARDKVVIFRLSCSMPCCALDHCR